MSLLWSVSWWSHTSLAILFELHSYCGRLVLGILSLCIRLLGLFSLPSADHIPPRHSLWFASFAFIRSLLFFASLCVYLTHTITWSVGIADSLITQSKVNGSTLSDMYMRSSLACICSIHVCALYMKAISVGFAQHHMSLMFHSCLTPLRAAIADWSSSLGGILSMASSVTLKSPSVKSSTGRCLVLLVVITFAQKFACSFLLLGVYTFSIVVVHNLNHFTFSTAALLGINLCNSNSSGSINCLLMMKPTPAVAQGFLGGAEIRIFKFFSKALSSCSVMLWSRWASCMASIAIFSVCIVLLIDFHFSL